MDQMHLTLRFIGEVNDQQFEEIRTALDEVQTGPFELSLKGVGFFPPRGSPRILWIGLEPCEELQALFGMIERSLEKLGFEREKQKYAPHITVARIKQTIRPAAVMPFISQNSLFKAGPVTVDAFHLYSSVLRPEGPVHRLEESYQLL
jgi:2'-5' RNA ligase